MAESNKGKGLFFAAAGLALAAMFMMKPNTQVYPPKNTLNRIFMTVQSPDELQAVLGTSAGLRGNLYVGFVRLGSDRSNKLAQSLWKAVGDTQFKTKEVAAVCVELDGGRNDAVVNEYVVQTVPSVVRLYKGVLTGDRTEEMDEEKLREWVQKTLQ